MNIGSTDTFSTAILAHLFHIIVCVGKSSTHTFTMRSACLLEQEKKPRQSAGFILSAIPICHVYLGRIVKSSATFSYRKLHREYNTRGIYVDACSAHQNHLDVIFRNIRQILSFREIFSQQTVRVLVGSPLPRLIWLREVEWCL